MQETAKKIHDQTINQSPKDEPSADNPLFISSTNGIFIFGEPLGVDTIKIGEGLIQVEIDPAQARKTVQDIKNILLGDKENGKRWYDLGGIIITPQILRNLVAAGVVTKEQVLAATVATNNLEIDFKAPEEFYNLLQYGEEHPRIETLAVMDLERKLRVMRSADIIQTYGGDYEIITADKNWDIL